VLGSEGVSEPIKMLGWMPSKAPSVRPLPKNIWAQVLHLDSIGVGRTPNIQN